MAPEDELDEELLELEDELLELDEELDELPPEDEPPLILPCGILSK